MGTFDFLCKECNLKFEFTILGNSESAEPYCPECLGHNIIKLFSPPKVVIGLESVSVNSELYFRPDKPPNPAKMWNKFAYNCEKLETEGKIPKVKDGVEKSIKAWTDAGHEL